MSNDKSGNVYHSKVKREFATAKSNFLESIYHLKSHIKEQEKQDDDLLAQVELAENFMYFCEHRMLDPLHITDEEILQLTEIFTNFTKLIQAVDVNHDDSKENFQGKLKELIKPKVIEFNNFINQSFADLSVAQSLLYTKLTDKINNVITGEIGHEGRTWTVNNEKKERLKSIELILQKILNSSPRDRKLPEFYKVNFILEQAEKAFQI